MPHSHPDTHVATHQCVAGGTGFENGLPCRTVGFDYGDLDSVEINDDELAKSRIQGAIFMLKFIDPDVSVERAGKRAKLTRFILGISKYKTQVELAKELGMTPSGVTQQLNSLRLDFARHSKRL